MNKKDLIKSIDKIVQIRVNRQLESMRKEIKREVIKEVSSIIDYSERKLLAEISKVNDTIVPRETSDNSLDKKLSEITSNRTKSKPKKKFASDPILNDILNTTQPLNDNSGRTYTQDHSTFDDDTQIPTHTHGSALLTEDEVRVGLDGKMNDTTNENVQKVLDVINNTNFKEKFESSQDTIQAFRQRVGG